MLRFNKRAFLLPLFLLPLLLVAFSYNANVVAVDFDDFSYNPVYWEDWGVKSGATQTVEIEPTDDAYTAQGNPTSLHDDEVSLIGDENSGGDRHAYFKWDLSAYSGYEVSKVELRIYCRYFTVVGSRDFDYYPVHNQSWLASSLCWNNQPPKGSTFASLTSTGIQWYTLDDSDILNHTQSYLGSNMSLAFYTADVFNGKYSYFSQTYEATKEPYIILHYSGGATLSYDWHNNSTLSLYSESLSWSNASIYRALDVSEGDAEITVSSSFRTNASTYYQNSTMFICEYAQPDVNRFLGVFFASNQIGVVYYNWSGQFTTYNFTHVLNPTEYYTVTMDLSSYTRTLSVEVENSTTAVFDKVVFMEAAPPQVENVSFCLNAENSITQANLLWVDAPFGRIDGLREWHIEQDSPYSIEGESQDVTNYVKVMPFQGFKAQWNNSITTNAPLDLYLNFTFVALNGTRTGQVLFWCDWVSGPSAAMYFKIQTGLTPVTVESVTWSAYRSGGFDYSGQISCALWIEASGRMYAYLQVEPHSSDYSDFWVVDVTSEINLDSWGCIISHQVDEVSATAGVADSVLREVEIFYGMREGISQPRFGGMWWLVNPLAMWLLQVGFLIAQSLSPLVLAVQPLITSVTGAVTGLVVWLSDQLDTMLNIWGVVASLVVDINNLMQAFIVPLWTFWIEYLINNFVEQVFGTAFLVQSVFAWVLTQLSGWFFGDVTLLPNAVAGIQLLIAAIVYAIVDFFISGNIANIGLYLVGLMSGHSGPIGYPMDSAIMGLGSMGMLVMYWVITYGPYMFLIYILITIVRCMGAFMGNYDFAAFEPLLNLFKLFVWLAQLVWGIISKSATLIWDFITAVMELIPF